MKKLFVTIAAATAIVASSSAQGLVIFSSSTQNVSTNNSVAQLGATAGGKIQGSASGGNGYYFALFYSTTTPSSTAALQGTGGTYAFANGSGWTFAGSGSLATNTGTAGRFAAAAPQSDGSVAIPTVAAGSDTYLVTIGWSANLGSTLSALETALNTPGDAGFIGQSVASGLIETGNAALGGSTPDSATFGSSAPFMQGFTLGSFVVATPEPATMALAAIGGASLLLFRRKK